LNNTNYNAHSATKCCAGINCNTHKILNTESTCMVNKYYEPLLITTTSTTSIKKYTCVVSYRIHYFILYFIICIYDLVHNFFYIILFYTQYQIT